MSTSTDSQDDTSRTPTPNEESSIPTVGSITKKIIDNTMDVPLRKGETALLKQFYLTLESILIQIKNHDATPNPHIMEEINDIMALKRTWGSAYKVEQLLVEVFDDDMLELELKRRFLEIQNTLADNHIKFFEDEIKTSDTIAKKRVVLARLVNDLQWKYSIKEVKNSYLRTARRHVSIVLVFSIISFAVTSVMMWDDGGKTTWMMLLLVGASGFMGATFSMLTGLNSKLEKSSFNDLKVIHTLGYIFSRAIIGVGASIILFYFILSSYISGDFLPSIGEEGNIIDLEKLIVLAVIAGFSEKLIPNLISKSEAKINDQN